MDIEYNIVSKNKNNYIKKGGSQLFDCVHKVDKNKKTKVKCTPNDSYSDFLLYLLESKINLQKCKTSKGFTQQKYGFPVIELSDDKTIIYNYTFYSLYRTLQRDRTKQSDGTLKPFSLGEGGFGNPIYATLDLKDDLNVDLNWYDYKVKNYYKDINFGKNQYSKVSEQKLEINNKIEKFINDLFAVFFEFVEKIQTSFLNQHRDTTTTSKDEELEINLNKPQLMSVLIEKQLEFKVSMSAIRNDNIVYLEKGKENDKKPICLKEDINYNLNFKYVKNLVDFFFGLIGDDVFDIEFTESELEQFNKFNKKNMINRDFLKYLLKYVIYSKIADNYNLHKLKEISNSLYENAEKYKFFADFGESDGIDNEISKLKNFVKDEHIIIEKIKKSETGGSHKDYEINIKKSKYPDYYFSKKRNKKK